MDYIFVTLKTRELGSVDLKIPINITIQELLGMFAEALDLPLEANRQVQAEPLGRILDNKTTLAAEGVTNGSLLTVI